ncbi:DgyrCDS6594 [Dimorphilus gyrociliatus]|uniref:DgyrCDS6594 n=1 Tax=Dimorphilus gyrociliatus TaxID=2664684 RepID=A0A7I8VNI7_9ANNE|nr:DgyrCDS6594 [Dimorphilus gyrociliatus]
MANFSISGENLDNVEDVNDDNKPKSRFKVEQVNELSSENRKNEWSEKPLSFAAKRLINSQSRPRQISTSSSSPPLSPNLNAENNSYDTANAKNANLNTLETLPHVDHYRNLFSANAVNLKKRPTLVQLREMQEEYDAGVEGEAIASDDKQMQPNGPNGDVTTTAIQQDAKPVKFGWIKGVLVRCLLNIWGVMLFLRLSWVVGQAGIGLSILVIGLSAVVTVLTTLSMSAICTNGQVKGGGAYYLISRSLGPEFGGAIGLVFSVANAVAVSMYVVGFAETIRDILRDRKLLMVDEVNDVRIIGLITVVFLLCIALIGMEWEARAQLILLVILLIAMINIIIGSFISPSDSKKSKGYVGYGSGVIKDNFNPDFRDGENFFSVFAIFFPAATGILAGANISGDLKDAQRAIPKGTLLAILISSVSYIGMAVLAGASVARDATGNLNVTENITEYCQQFTCEFGLQNDMQVMQLISGFGPLVIAGTFAATLSSALASLVSAPKVFQAVSKDNIFPYISVFAKGYGKNDEPRLAYLLSFFIAAGFIAIGQLNSIAPLISNFFLMSYALINYSCFDASLAKSPGWRPGFKYYNMWSALFGALLCLCVMFIIKWWTALITFFIITGLYIYVHHKKPDINWGSSTQAHVYRNALNSTLKLVSVLEHIKNYRPQVFALTGHPMSRPDLTRFAATITKDISLLMCVHVISGEKDFRSNSSKTKHAYDWLSKNKIKGFYSCVCSESLRSGVSSALQTSGLGKLKPNTLLLGFKGDWKTCDQFQVHEYVSIIHDAFDLRYGVGILRVDEGFYVSNLPMQSEEGGVDDEKILLKEQDGKENNEGSLPTSRSTSPTPRQSVCAPRYITSRQLAKAAKKNGTIDVWWLFDDGGLTLLIPYLLSGHWRNCKLRVFGAASRKGELDRDQRSLATLLSKFRIDYASIKIIADIGRTPSADGIARFNELIKPWMLEPGETPESHPWKVSETVLNTQKDKTYRQIRLRELLQEHSSSANLIVLTLPMPRKSIAPSGLYMCWLETITKDMPPILLLRGNQESVLTFYS